MSTPVVSVLIPAYRAAATIGKALRSVLRQDWRELEIIVVDDASPDDTFDVASALDDGRVRVLRNEVNAGPSVSRNRALEASTGEWLATLDADDTWEPGRLTTLLGLAARHGVTMVADDINFVRPGHRTPETTALRRNKAPAMNRVVGAAELIAADLGIYQPVMHRAVFESGLRWNDEMRFTEDFDLYLRALLEGHTWYQSDAALYNYVLWPGSSVSRQVELCSQAIESLDRLMAQVDADAATSRALERRRRQTVTNLSYARMWEDVAARRYGRAVRQVARHPRFAVTAGGHIRRTLAARLRYRLEADPVASAAD